MTDLEGPFHKPYQQEGHAPCLCSRCERILGEVTGGVLSGRERCKHCGNTLCPGCCEFNGAPTPRMPNGERC
jgi:hypothetical protein